MNSAVSSLHVFTDTSCVDGDEGNGKNQSDKGRRYDKGRKYSSICSANETERFTLRKTPCINVPISSRRSCVDGCRQEDTLISSDQLYPGKDSIRSSDISQGINISNRYNSSSCMSRLSDNSKRQNYGYLHALKIFHQRYQFNNHAMSSLSNTTVSLINNILFKFLFFFTYRIS